MAYLRIWFSTPICVAWLGAIDFYVKQRFDVKIPIVMLALVYASVALDGTWQFVQLVQHEIPVHPVRRNHAHGDLRPDRPGDCLAAQRRLEAIRLQY